MSPRITCFNCVKSIEQADGIELRPLQRHLYAVIMPVRILAFALVAAQGVPRRKCIFDADLKHAGLLFLFFPGDLLFRQGWPRTGTCETSPNSLVLR